MYEERILKEFPQQFQGKEPIKILVRAFASQLDELSKVFDDLTRLRSVDTAQGKQLDGVGDIVVLTRSDAMRLIKGAITYDIIDDEHYRHYIRYKILKNTSICTYYDIIQAIQMLWDVNNIEYFEDPKEPATMTLTFPDPGGAERFDDIPPIKAAGVGIHIRAKSEFHIKQKIFVGSCLGLHDALTIRPRPSYHNMRQTLFTGTSLVLHEEMQVRPSKQQPRNIKLSLGFGQRLVVHETVTVRPGGKEMVTVGI